MVEAKDFLRGDSLHVVLYTDASEDTSERETVETFELPHILINGEKFLGKTGTNNPADNHPGLEDTGWDLRMPSSYCYFNFTDIVVNSSYLSGMIRIYVASKYSRIQFTSCQDYRLIWDSYDHKDMEDVRSSVIKGGTFKVMVLDEDDLWNGHPVDLMQYFPEIDNFRIFTHKDGYPNAFRNFSELEMLSRNFAESGETTGYSQNHPFFSSQYILHANGKYGRLFDDGGSRKGEYKRLKIFTRI